jgi:hypothetical protein
VVIEHSLLQVNHPQRSRQEENTQEPGKGCGMWVVGKFSEVRTLHGPGPLQQ